jgi:hypothetical protein
MKPGDVVLIRLLQFSISELPKITTRFPFPAPFYFLSLVWTHTGKMVRWGIGC